MFDCRGEGFLDQSIHFINGTEEGEKSECVRINACNIFKCRENKLLGHVSIHGSLLTPLYRHPIIFGSTMSSPLMTWDNFSRSLELPTELEQVNVILDRQRGYEASLTNGDIFLSRTDLRMHIDRCRLDARVKLQEWYSQAHMVDPNALPDLILHASAWLKVSPHNTNQLVKDYPDLVRHRDGNGSLPLHTCVRSVGDDHCERLGPFLDLFPEAAQCLDGDGILPLHCALICGADCRVVQMLLECYMDACKYIFLPSSPVKKEFVKYIGMLPVHLAFCCSSVDVIYCLLLQSPEVLSEAGNGNEVIWDLS